jgi:carboxypeptidase PM20D1
MLDWLIPGAVALIIAAAVLIVVIRTARFKPPAAAPAGGYIPDGDTTAAEKLAEAVRVRTVSYIDDAKIDRDAFAQFHALLEKQFPLAHARCEKTVINNYSLVYHLKSDRPERSGKPVLITAHMDVVPVEEGTEGAWTHPPFRGSIADGIVWGRGTLDIKVHLIGVLEALERLLCRGFSPVRDIYFAFGHDEELNGRKGALQIVDYFKNQGLEFDFVLDEGGCVALNVLPGIDAPIALVGVGEKGYANIKLTVTRDGGHSSMPAPHTSLGLLAGGLWRIENHPFKPRLIKPTRDFLMRVGPYMKGLNRVILANLWLFKPVFLSVFGKTQSGSALLRTTIAVTMAQGSPAPNVVPQISSAVVNCRILPGENGGMVLAHFRKTLKNLPVTVEPITMDDPSALSSADSDAFRFVESLIGEFCPGAVVAPYLVMAATDAKKYEPVCQNIFRFTPFIIDIGELGKIHGTNESISVANVNRCVDFFTALLERL